MPVLEKPPIAEPRKAVTIRLPQSVNISLHRYAEFLDCSLEHVVVEALKRVFKKDTEFQKWASENATDENKQPRPQEPQTREQDFLQPIIADPTQQIR